MKVRGGHKMAQAIPEGREKREGKKSSGDFKQGQSLKCRLAKEITKAARPDGQLPRAGLRRTCEVLRWHNPAKFRPFFYIFQHQNECCQIDFEPVLILRSFQDL